MPFPITPILDNFNRANEGPPPSSGWYTPWFLGGTSSGLRVLSNQCTTVVVDISGAAATNALYGPDSEVYVTLATRVNNGDYVAIGARHTQVGPGNFTLYHVNWHRVDATGDYFDVFRVVGGVTTEIIADTPLAMADGDSLGMSVIGTTIRIYHKPAAGSWTAVASVTDSAISGAGQLFLFLDDPTARSDDFGGGNAVEGITMPSFPPVPPSADPKKPGYVLTLQDPSGTIIGFITPDKTGVRRLPRGPGVERQSRRQTSIAGGRGASRFEEDTTRYFDSFNLWSMVEGNITPGPHFGIAQMVGVKQNRNVHSLPTGWTRQDWTTGYSGWAGKFTVPTGGYTDPTVSILLRKRTTSITNSHRMAIYSDVAGVPGAIVSGAPAITDAELPGTTATWVTTVLGGTLSAGVSYWLVLETVTPAAEFQIEMILQNSGNGARRNATTGTWSTHAAAPLYYIREFQTQFDIVKFFEYKRSLYMVAHRIAAAASEIYLNGDRGVATGAGQSATVLQDTTKTWVDGEWIGSVLYCYQGPNIGESRTIQANGVSTITTSPFPVAHTAGATGEEYVIVGTDKWTKIVPSPNLTSVCKSMAACNDIVYMAQTDATAILRMREYNNAGVWTRETALDGSSTATLLVTAPHWDTGEQSVYRYSLTAGTVSVAKKQPWGTNLTFETAIDTGNKDTTVRGMALYNNSVWIGKEDSVWVLKNGKFSQVPIAMEAARDLRNGVALIGWNTNLYYSFLEGLERLYGQVVDDIGPNRDLGMPAGRQGAITSSVSVLQYLFCSYDAGGGTSSILATTSPGGDWHEIFRAIQAGDRISAIHYQSIPGVLNRLWMHHGADIFYLYQADNIYFPSNDASMVVTPESYWVTAWHDANTPELDHFFHEMRVMTGSLQGRIRIDYKVDDDANEWQVVPGYIATTPLGDLTIGDGEVTGRRIKFRFVVEDEGVTGATVVNSTELRCNTMNEVIYDYHIDLRLVDKIELMDGRQDYSTDAIEVINQLEAWKEIANPLTMRFAAPGGGTVFDNVRVHLDPVSLVIGEWNERTSKLTGNIVLKAIG